MRHTTENRGGRRGAAEHERGGGPPRGRAAAVLALQRAAGNRAVGVLARQVPRQVLEAAERAQRPPDLSPRGQADRNPQWGEAPAREKPRPQHASRADATSWSSLPDALREVLERSWGEAAFSRYGTGLSDEARGFLVAWYNRMVQYGLWGHVRTVKVIEPGEAPVRLGPVSLYVQGLSQSVLFEVYDGAALRQAMLSSQRFGKDVGASGLLHLGQTSLREYTLTTTDGLHLSIGGGTAADAHLDKRSPTDAPHAGETRMDWIRSWEHHWQEVWPEFIRKAPGFLANAPRHVYEWLVDKTRYLGLGRRFREALKQIPRSFFNIVAAAVGLTDAAWAGTTVKPGEDIEDPTTRPRGSWIVILKEYRFGAGKGRPAGRPVEAPAAQASLAPEIADAVTRAVTTALPGIVKPSGGRLARDDYAETELVGEALARLILFRARGGSVTVGIDLGPVYAGLSKPEVDDVTAQLVTIGKAAREALAAALTAKGDDRLAADVLLVRSAVTPLGGTLVTFPLH